MVTPTPGAGGLRDPFIMRKQDGTFVVLATDLKGTDWTQQQQYIHVWDSTDLRTFTGYRRVKLHDMTTTHSWAPEAFWDASRGQYGILYSSVNSSGRDVIMVNYTTDFVTRQPPRSSSTPASTSSTATSRSASTASTTSTTRGTRRPAWAPARPP